jgi:hypothetical protein
MTLKLQYINQRPVFEQMSDTEKTDAYFKLVEQIRALEQKTNKPLKNSQNSSQAPHTDLTRPHQKGEEGKSGPPAGHEGVSRKIKPEPDHVITAKIHFDPETGEAVKSNSQSFQIHQVLELEPARMIVVEIQRQVTTVNGRTVTAPNPEGVGDHDRIGPNLKSHVAYMRFVLNVPWNKIRRWLKEVAGDTVAVGTLASIFRELQALTIDDIKAIKSALRGSKVVGADETSML